VAKWRLCLRCERDFWSEWAGHRLCEPCVLHAALHPNEHGDTPNCHVRDVKDYMPR
jgi:hypothetical protein